MKNDAILLTQYEKYGVLKREDFVQCFIDEMDINLSFVGRYNEWLAEQGDAGFTADWEELVKQLDPVEPLIMVASVWATIGLLSMDTRTSKVIQIVG